jgi:seryl-tRNA synthetase
MVTENEQTNQPDNDSESVSSYVPRGERLKSELTSISALTDRLESACKSLPHVNACRQSDLSYARRLYEEKERLEQELISKVEVLKQYHKALTREVDRCMKNLQTIQEDATKLNLQETSEYYSQAEEAQLKQYDSAVEDRDAISVVLKKAQAVLSMSKTRKFPGSNFGGHFLFPAGIPGSLASTSQSPAGGFNNEITGLISMGPLGKRDLKN